MPTSVSRSRGSAAFSTAESSSASGFVSRMIWAMSGSVAAVLPTPSKVASMIRGAITSTRPASTSGTQSESLAVW